MKLTRLYLGGFAANNSTKRLRLLTKTDSSITNYIAFESPNDFTLTSNYQNWNGVVEYSTDASSWNVWNGSLLSSDQGKLYLRGTRNTRISKPQMKNLVFEGAEISCKGNIESLLDFATVAKGEHPPMESRCFDSLFYGCSNLISAPELPATVLSEKCYYGMFTSCTNLTTIPKLPATVLANNCYAYMFMKCSSLLINTVQSANAPHEYRIPTSGDGTDATDALKNMLVFTGGSFNSSNGTPTINTTYYTQNEPV